MPHHIETYGHGDRIGVVLDLSAGDAFTLRTSEFRRFARDLALHIAAADPADEKGEADITALLNQPFFKDESMTVRDLFDRCSTQLGTPVHIHRYVRLSAPGA
ncbi:MAG: hypothetical protein V2J02_17645 [Pseudomonadales bacterium]|jgi:elongation factor Ts|nr:hypothetical protein [Pseudomonadales bacterium]